MSMHLQLQMNNMFFLGSAPTWILNSIGFYFQTCPPCHHFAAWQEWYGSLERGSGMSSLDLSSCRTLGVSHLGGSSLGWYIICYTNIGNHLSKHRTTKPFKAGTILLVFRNQLGDMMLPFGPTTKTHHKQKTHCEPEFFGGGISLW